MEQVRKKLSYTGGLTGRHGRLFGNAAQALNKSRDGTGGVRRTGLLDGGDQGAADHRGVGELTDSGKLFRGRDAKPDGDGEVGEAPQAADQLLRVGVEGLLRASDTGAGDGVDESLRRGCDFLKALVGAGRSGEKGGRETEAVQ